MTTIPELDERENSWVVYRRANKGCVETADRVYAEKAAAPGPDDFALDLNTEPKQEKET